MLSNPIARVLLAAVAAFIVGYVARGCAGASPVAVGACDPVAYGLAASSGPDQYAALQDGMDAPFLTPDGMVLMPQRLRVQWEGPPGRLFMAAASDPAGRADAGWFAAAPVELKVVEGFTGWDGPAFGGGRYIVAASPAGKWAMTIQADVIPARCLETG